MNKPTKKPILKYSQDGEDTIFLMVLLILFSCYAVLSTAPTLHNKFINLLTISGEKNV